MAELNLVRFITHDARLSALKDTDVARPRLQSDDPLSGVRPACGNERR